ncbi:hypothetical protein F5Y15DRAFT_380965 [Xylariaceae sp. FL0016]|nr:hypothetical protein F5Y15DRAFT_380965 [Xylariaceae sp. FL0016]
MQLFASLVSCSGCLMCLIATGLTKAHTHLSEMWQCTQVICVCWCVCVEMHFRGFSFPIHNVVYIDSSALVVYLSHIHTSM